MKRFTLIGLFLFVCGVVFGTGSEGAGISSIINTRHDLSSNSSATIRSAATGLGTDEICVFCHTPHSGRKDAPLWNRTDVSGPYSSMYSSDVMVSLGMTGEDPSSNAALGYAAHVKTRICLSCHDGTIALGNVVNLPNSLSANVAMQGTGVDGQGKLLSSAAGYIGLDLSDDHPVAIRHDTTKDLELTAPSAAKRIYLYDVSAARTSVGTGTGYVECTSCHNAHDNQYGNFLVSTNQGSSICLGCHTKELGAAVNSAHDNATTVGYAPPSGGTAPNPTTLGASVGSVKCMICHFPHKAGITDTAQLPAASPGTSGKYLLSFQEDRSCFNEPNRWKSPDPAGACHGTGGVGAVGKNIDLQTQMNKNYSAHSAFRNGSFNAGYSNKHGAIEQGVSGNASYGSIPPHVVCSDCHNPHTAGGTNHVQGTNTIAVASPLYGAGGVAFSPGLGAWTVPGAGSYNAYEPLGAKTRNPWTLPKYEYEICFKCHTSFAWGAGSKPNISDLSGISNMTDQLQEFNPANPSYHTVMAGLSATSYAPPASSFANGWTSGGLMYCSDCHGNDISLGQPQGAHGSANPGILVLPFSDTYGTAGGSPQPGSGSDLCYKCHAYSVYGSPIINTPNGTNTGFSSTGNINLHTQHAYRAQGQAFTVTPITSPWSYKCVNCHTRVSHGWKRRGLVVFQGDGAGYEAGGLNTGPIQNTSALPGAPAANQYGPAINANCTIQAGVTGCHHN